MPGKRRNSLEARIRTRIEKGSDAVFVRADFIDLEAESGYDQIGRALRKLVKEGILLRGGYGVYVRARLSRFSGRPVPDVGMYEMAEQAMRKLGAEVEPTLMEQRYNRDETTQVPNGRVIRVKRKLSRKLQYGDAPLSYERA
jgi:hypothetical protein